MLSQARVANIITREEEEKPFKLSSEEDAVFPGMQIIYDILLILS